VLATLSRSNGEKREAYLGWPGRVSLDLGEDEVAELGFPGPLAALLGAAPTAGRHWRRGRRRRRTPLPPASNPNLSLAAESGGGAERGGGPTLGWEASRVGTHPKHPQP
jgi:hypothetical protein